MSEHLEEPKFKIIQKYKRFEVRKYVDTIQAQVSSPIFEKVNSNFHFRQIANYIFGDNDMYQNISMTAPVHTWKQDNEKLMAFTMPSKFNLQNLPKPNDNEVKLLNIEGETVAVLKFSWFSGKFKTEKLIKKLQSYVKKEGLKENGAPKLAVYDNPMTTLPFMRRNEIHLPIFC